MRLLTLTPLRRSSLAVTPTATRTPALSRAFPALSNRNLRLLRSGLLLSRTGGWIQRIAQDWLVLTLTNSPVAFGAVTACQFLPTLVFGLHDGLLADRLPKGRILLATQASTSVTAATLAALSLSDHRASRLRKNASQPAPDSVVAV